MKKQNNKTKQVDWKLIKGIFRVFLFPEIFIYVLTMIVSFFNCVRAGFVVNNKNCKETAFVIAILVAINFVIWINKTMKWQEDFNDFIKNN